MKHKYINANKKLLSLFALAFLVLCFPVVSGCDYTIPPHVDVPEITYAEFPFQVVYEMDGEVITLNETLICEYAGETWDGSRYERYRTWKQRYAGGEDLILKRISDTEYIGFCLGGTSAYWMGDTESPSYCITPHGGDHVVLTEKTKLGMFIYFDELYEKFGIRIIDVKTSAPIENTFTPPEEPTPSRKQKL